MKLELSPKLLVALAVLGVGVLASAVILATGPRISQRPGQAVAPLIRVMEVQPTSTRLRVATHGTVIPRTESELVPEVSGRVVWVSPSLVSGGFFEAEEPLLRIDARDYEVALERARAAVQRSSSEHRNARKELKRQQDLAERNIASPSQLDSASNAERVAGAVLREARAHLEQSERDLERAELKAIYRGRVRSESIDVGQFVTRGQSLARLYAVDFAEVRLPIPDQDLAYLNLPMLYRDDVVEEVGSEVILRAEFAGQEHVWNGHVVRTEGEIDPRTRMINVVARVADPYARQGDRPPLSLGLFVEAEILGRAVENVFILPRSVLRGRDRVFVVDQDDRLRFRKVGVLQTTDQDVFIESGLNAGERICSSSLEVPIDGMFVRVAEAKAP